MDIYEQNFWGLLPTVLQAISEALFVSFDLEMTGIKWGKSAKPTSSLSVQEAYQELKKGAEGFQILQFGLTCGYYDTQKSAYVLQTFNFHLTPMFTGRDYHNKALSSILDRKVTLSYKSLTFLHSHGIRLEETFWQGVPYLSRQERLEAEREFLVQNQADSPPSVVNVAQLSPEARQFYETVRERIATWVKDLKTGRDFINITNPHGGRVNHYQRRLVDKIVSIECPGYRTHFRHDGHFVQVLKQDVQHEQHYQRKRLEERKAAVGKQTGFRFVIEAITGGRFAADIDPRLLLSDPASKARIGAVADMRKMLEKHEQKLVQHRPILVGHNQMADLCFLYRTFIGHLPDRLEEFQDTIHAIFPRIIDTKYMTSRGGHDMLPDISLKESYDSFKGQKMPAIEYHGLFSHTGEQIHTAGYDSMMTAVVLLKLSHNLARDKAHLRPAQPEDENPATSSEGYLTADNKTTTAPPPPPTVSRFATKNPFSILSPDKLRPTSRLASSRSTGSLLDDEDEHQRSPQQVMPLNPTRTPEGTDFGSAQVTRQHQGWTPIRDKRRVSKEVKVATAQQKGSAVEDDIRIPDWNTDFWKKFGNKVRVGDAGIAVFGRSPPTGP